MNSSDFPLSHRQQMSHDKYEAPCDFERHESSMSVPALESLMTGILSTENMKPQRSNRKSHAEFQVKRRSTKAYTPLEPKTVNNNALSWRSDPSTSFSDWTIEVAIVEDNTVVSSSFYHCHSNVLVWGPRRSAAFLELFQDRMKQVPPSLMTQIELPPTEAEVFPMLLDFMYCETTLPLSADRVCSIYVLADRFENVMLQTAIQTFIEKSLDFEQSIEFLSYAKHHKDRAKIEKLVLFTNSKLCGYLVRNPDDASKIPPDLLAHILQMRAQVIKVLKGEDPRKFSGKWETERSRLLSTVIAECCLHAMKPKLKSQRLSRPTFLKLIDSKHLPALDSYAALSLLQVDFLLEKQGEAEHQERKVPVGNKMDEQAKDTMSSLEARCVNAIVIDWRSIMSDNQTTFFAKSLAQIKSDVLAQILVLVSKNYEEAMTKKSHTADIEHDILVRSPYKRATRGALAVHFDSPPRCEILETSLTPTHDWCHDMDDAGNGVEFSYRADDGQNDSSRY